MNLFFENIGNERTLVLVLGIVEAEIVFQIGFLKIIWSL